MFTPYDHQTAACSFLLDGGSLLAHDPGCGKTFSTLMACEADVLGGATLIGCPSVAMGVWEREINLVAPAARLLLLTAKTLRYLGDGWDYIVVSVDLVARNGKIRLALLDMTFERVVIDECHYLKNPDARRTQAWLLGIAGEALAGLATEARRWLLSGTPAPNHAGELWPLIAGTRPALLGGRDWAAFEDRFCRHKMVKRNGHQVRVVAGSNLVRVKELRTTLAGWWDRVKKADVLTDLPDKMFRTVPIEIGKLDASAQRLQDSPEGIALAAAITASTAAMADLDDDDSMSRFRSLISEAKAPMAAEYVANVLATGEPAVLMWFWHRDGMDVAEAWFKANKISTCRIDGSTTQGRKRQIEEQFQRPDGPQVFIGQIKAAGVSITLTRAAYEVFAEVSWNPAENWQASDRCHRIGQKRGVVVDFLAVRDTLDMTVLSTCERKTREIEELERPL